MPFHATSDYAPLGLWRRNTAGVADSTGGPLVEVAPVVAFQYAAAR